MVSPHKHFTWAQWDHMLQLLEKKTAKNRTSVVHWWEILHLIIIDILMVHAVKEEKCVIKQIIFLDDSSEDSRCKIGSHKWSDIPRG